MTGSGLAAILIPIAGTIFLATWLALVFYAGGHPGRAGNPAPVRQSPGPAALADRRQSGALLRGAAKISPEPAMGLGWGRIPVGQVGQPETGVRLQTVTNRHSCHVRYPHRSVVSFCLSEGCGVGAQIRLFRAFAAVPTALPCQDLHRGQDQGPRPGGTDSPRLPDALTANEFELTLGTDLAAGTAGGGLIAGWKAGIIRGFRGRRGAG